jgi:hypothetical protein
LLQLSSRCLHASLSAQGSCGSIPAKIIMALAGWKGKSVGQPSGRIIWDSLMRIAALTSVALIGSVLASTAGPAPTEWRRWLPTVLGSVAITLVAIEGEEEPRVLRLR